MQVLFVSSECAPFAKAGGLADVVGALPKALLDAGVDVRVLLPRYSYMDVDGIPLAEPLGVPMPGGEAWCGVVESRLPGSHVPIYFLEHDALFDRDGPYAAEGLHALAGFGLLCRGAFQLCRALDWIPDVMHVHDWPTAPIASRLLGAERGAPFDRTASVMTIHNMAHQPRFPAEGMELLGLPPWQFSIDGLEDYGELNPFKGGCAHATVVTTVSPTYADEIKSSPGGCGLDELMRARGDDLVGIVNGVDTTVWDPSQDPYIAATYSPDAPAGKRLCKSALQQQMGLDVRADVPLIGVVSRWTRQKGTDVIADAIDRILALDTQMLMLGSGDPDLEARLTSRPKDGRFAVYNGYNEGLAHQIEAGSDFFLMPSRFEPCGLNQMYSQRYGTLPIVRGTGGLKDTVDNCDPNTGAGTGFVLWDLHLDALVDTVAWAVGLYRSDPGLIAQMQRRAMRRDFAWSASAAGYLDVYVRAVGHVTGS